MRALIVLPGALGDVIRALPLVGRLKQAQPEVHVGWIVEPLSAPLLQGHPWIDTVYVFERKRRLAAGREIARRVRADGYDVVLDLGRGVKSALLAWASGAPERLGFAREDAREGSWLVATRQLPPQGVERSKLEQFLAFGDLLDCPPAPVGFGLAPSADEATAAAALVDGLPTPLVGACLGSSCPSRRWFPAPTVEVLQTVHERWGAGVVLLGTAADTGFAAEVGARLGSWTRDLTGRTSLRQLMAVLARCQAVFGPDSGAMHLAAALGVPVVSLWGATSPDRSAPYGSERWVVSGRAPCMPCFLKDCPIDRVCMEAIRPADVTGPLLEAMAA